MHNCTSSSEIKCCPACGRKDFTHYPHQLYRECRSCGSLYQYKEIKKIQDYYEKQVIDYGYQIGSYRSYLKIIRRFINHDKYKTLIDIGAGDGTFLDEAKKYFKIICGFDTSQMASKILTQKGYFIDRQGLGAITPKVITALQVIEHVPDPVAFINHLGLKADDLLVVTSPAVDSPSACRQHHTGKWRSLSPSHHLCLFTRKGLEEVAVRCDLDLINYEYVYSGCHGAVNNLCKHIFMYLKWPIKRLIGRKDSFPLFSGKNSFIAIFHKKNML
jgi:hypothetical protein